MITWQCLIIFVLSCHFIGCFTACEDNFHEYGEFFYFVFFLLRFPEAEDDCTEALNLDDRYIKAYSRRATTRKELGKLKESIEGVLIQTYILVFSDYLVILFLIVFDDDCMIYEHDLLQILSLL